MTMAGDRKPPGHWTDQLLSLAVGESVNLGMMNPDTYRGIVYRLRKRDGLHFTWRAGTVTRLKDVAPDPRWQKGRPNETAPSA